MVHFVSFGCQHKITNNSMHKAKGWACACYYHFMENKQVIPILSSKKFCIFVLVSAGSSNRREAEDR